VRSSRSDRSLLTVLIISSVTVSMMPEIVPLILVTVLAMQDKMENKECMQPLLVSLSELLERSDSVPLIKFSVSSSP
jgi:hypothetical protein